MSDKFSAALQSVKGIGGEYHWGDNAWAYVKEQSGFDLKVLLEAIAEENAHGK